MYKRVLLGLCILFLLLFSSCANQDIIDENKINTEKIEALEKDMDNLKNENNELKSQIQEFEEAQKTLNEETQFYLDFIAKLTEPMNENYLTQIAQQQWKYSILVNDIPIQENGILEVSADTVLLTVSEEQAEFTALPSEIHSKGKISGDLFATHIKFLDSIPKNTTGSEGDNITSTTYSFNNLNEVNVINLEISDELQERLGLRSNVITIRKVEGNLSENAEMNTLDSDTENTIETEEK